VYNNVEMTVTRKSGPEQAWLLLVFSLAKRNASLRVSVWRKLQHYGAVALGNSGYLLPNTSENRERFEWLATTIRTARGESSVVDVRAIDNFSPVQLKARFCDARSRDYRELLTDLKTVPGSPRIRDTQIARLRRRFQEISSIDFFGSPLREQVERALNQSSQPQSETDRPSRREYQKRLWVTRPRPGVDRVTSAWLIRKFIDPKARFGFSTAGRVPSGSVPFDMFEAGFSHRGDDCTFETLTKSFRIHDKKVNAIAQIVHDADLFDEKFGRKEGFGIDAIMNGWARQGLTDPELLNRGMQLTEGLYGSLG
jgi:hypothetical protein